MHFSAVRTPRAPLRAGAPESRRSWSVHPHTGRAWSQSCKCRRCRLGLQHTCGTQRRMERAGHGHASMHSWRCMHHSFKMSAWSPAPAPSIRVGEDARARSKPAAKLQGKGPHRTQHRDPARTHQFWTVEYLISASFCADSSTMAAWSWLES